MTETHLSTFSQIINRELFKSGELGDTTIELESYFKSVKRRYDSGEQYPYNIDELVPTVFARKDKAVEALDRDFTQGIDYRVITRAVENPAFGGRPANDYWLTPLAFEFMVARKSKPIFDIYHRIFHAATSPAFKVPQSFAEALQLAADQAKTIEMMAPKADYYDRLIGTEQIVDGEEAAKILRTSRSKLFALLRERGILTKKNLPMQIYIDKDFLRYQQTPYTDFFGTPRVSLKTVFTQSGLLYVRAMLDAFSDTKAITA